MIAADSFPIAGITLSTLLTDYVFVAISNTDLAEVELALQDFPKARYWLEKAKVYAGINIRRALVFLCLATGNLILSPERKESDFLLAAQLYGANDAISDQTGIKLNSFFQNQIPRELRLLRNKSPQMTGKHATWLASISPGNMRWKWQSRPWRWIKSAGLC